MLKRLWKILLLCLFSSSAYGATQDDWNDAIGLVFRWSGADAIRLRDALKESMPEKIDFGTIRYYGNLDSLACSNQDKCYLWLSRKEWTTPGPARLEFTLSLNGSVWKGQLDIDQARLQLLDVANQRAFALGGRIERSTLVKKRLAYPPSQQYLSNAENIVLSFEGAAAHRLFASRPADVDPRDGTRLRVQLGPEFFCWNLQPEIESPTSFVCQGRYTPAIGSLEFSSPFYAGDGLSLQPHFVSDIASTLSVFESRSPLGICPVSTKLGTDLVCRIFYNWNTGVDFYPISNPIQGVAVGWGHSETPPTDGS